MGTPSQQNLNQRGQVLLECAFALLFLVIMITSMTKHMNSKQAPFWSTLENSRIYKFKKYNSGQLK